MKAISENLYERGINGTNYCRRRIPAAVLAAYHPQKTHIVRSLGTTDLRLAKQRLKVEINRIDAEFAQHIRARDVAAHRRWMVRNFALTFAAVTLRLWLSASMVLGLPFQDAYPVIAWLCWIPNLLLAELAFNQTRNLSTRPTIAS